jgi:DNA (cytosine-5)-methyltransferase 1
MVRDSKVVAGGMYGVDLFSGAGGMSLGAEMAGVEVAFAVENDPAAFRTFSSNHRGVVALQAGVEQILDVALPLDPQRTIIFGGPPCQGFSTSNQKTRSISNEGNWLFKAFVALVAKVQPAWVVFENVRGIVELEKGHFAQEVAKDLNRLGYGTQSGVLNAVDFGVPQSRSRFFLIGRRGGQPPALPTGIVTSSATVRDAISDLPELELGAAVSTLPYRCLASSEFSRKMRGSLSECSNHLVSRNADFVVDRYSYIPEGGNWQDIPEHLMENYKDRSRCHTGIYRRLSWDKPSVVIGNFRKNMLIHPSQHRGLSVREAARLQAFPDSYEFHGSIGLQQQQVGNAVPPLLAKAVFDTILDFQHRVSNGG